MRTAIALLTILIATSCTAAGSGEKGAEMQKIADGGYAATTPEKPRAVAAFDEESYERIWSSMVGEDPRPQVDFAKNAVVFLFAGSRPTGGWTVEPKSVSVEGETLVVDAAINGPPRDGFASMALTSPYAVIAVIPRTFKDVRWQP
jgi:hypothetical protein